jgi:hypothetical protein
MAESLDLGGSQADGKLTILDAAGNVAARIVTQSQGTVPIGTGTTATALGPGRVLQPRPMVPGQTITGIVQSASDSFQIGHAGRDGVIEVNDASNAPVVSLSGANASATIGAQHHAGSLAVIGPDGHPAFTVKSVDAAEIVEIGNNGKLGAVRLLNAAGQLAVAIDGTTGQLFLFNAAGVPAIILDAGTGDISLGNGDIAEEFPAAEDVTAGCVVTLAASGCLERTTFAYDTRVAGVVSGLGEYRPGMVLGRKAGGSRRLPVAMLGTVTCLVDATAAPVRRGDLLTSSTRPGHAMAVTDRSRALGAVIGKALGDLSAGCGAISMLVSLR